MSKDTEKARDILYAAEDALRSARAINQDAQELIGAALKKFDFRIEVINDSLDIAIFYDNNNKRRVYAMISPYALSSCGKDELIEYINYALSKGGAWDEYPQKDKVISDLMRTRSEYNRVRDVLYSAAVARDGNRCNICGSTDNLTVDHIIPVSRGGSNDIGNIQILCRSCNSKKGNRT